MELHLFEPEELPRPQEEMRIERAEVVPYPDGRRVRVAVGWTAFVDRPNLDAVVLNRDGNTVSTFSVIEAITRGMDFTLHLRGAEPGAEYRLCLSLYYAPAPEEREAAAERQEEALDHVVDTREVTFVLPVPEEAEGSGQQREPGTGG
jgi:hypothetical protein